MGLRLENLSEQANMSSMLEMILPSGGSQKNFFKPRSPESQTGNAVFEF
jgi:hypothetical protein